MVKTPTVFKRYEKKYLITREQQHEIWQAIADQMQEDAFGRSTICNIYFDTPSDLLVRRSLGKPIYKEKLRVRAYGIATAQTPVFVELKKKYKSVVYKRRVAMPEQDAMAYLCEQAAPPATNQITRELDYFRAFYGKLMPKVFLSYERQAFYAKEDPEFRVTFDENIRWRTKELSLCAGPYGTLILPEDKVLMELKTIGALPLWMTQILTKQRIYQTSFSKYGTVYQQLMTSMEGA